MLTAIIYEKLPKIKPPRMSRKEERHLYYLQHKDQMKAKCHEYYIKNREEIIKRNRTWNDTFGKMRIQCPTCNLEMNRASLYRHKKRHTINE